MASRAFPRLLFRLMLAIGALLIILAAAAWAAIANPPELLRIGAAYAAKTVCSNVFVAGRDSAGVLAHDVQAPGHPILEHLEVRIDQQRKVVRADLFGVIGGGVAVYRPGTGCAVVPDGDVARASLHNFVPIKIWSPSPSVPWPTGSMAETVPGVQALVNQDALSGPGMRGIAVIHRGRLVAQRYGDGFALRTPQLGWSLTKTVNAALVGMHIAEGKLSPQQSGFWAAGADGRSRIALSHLMAMSSGLRFDETYGGVSDLTRMLYLEPDMAAYAAAQPLVQPAGTAWNDSSGTALLLSRIWQRAAAGTNAGAGDGANAGERVAIAGALPAKNGPASVAVLSLPHDRLFAPLGMSSALIEADARGNLVGASYMYASTHDWARFGQFLLQDGVWQGKRMLPAGFVEAMRQPAPASGGQYGQGQVWRHGPQGATPPGQNPDLPFKLPADTFWMLGHDGQSIAIVPSRGLVLVRLGLTPERLGYQPQALLAAIIEALEPDAVK
ncbi:CubicO group peptidase, beta-lactamase class C family [Duganella sp. CF517]|uniref:serine hydrolase domain-containing protein n=1 Tax=Duganella sp. CF517 TaxID=1881038 RepID=UPI0008B8B178|nr:serine hydrolase [Duganella sp. CF517]SEN17985.1 CubicO group peptidase, beta-lactamase class C family [Duganella sp. CF517]